MMKLEELTVDYFWELLKLDLPPPPDAEAELTGRMFYRCGFGAVVVLALRLESETPERRKAILDMLNAQITEGGGPLRQ